MLERLILLGFRVLPHGGNQWRPPCNRQGGATRYQVVNSTKRCRAAAKVRKVAAKFQALAVIPRLQALFILSLMRALLYDSFGAPPRIANIADPVVPQDGVVVEVKASGLCRSDWHGWLGHDADIRTLPH